MIGKPEVPEVPKNIFFEKDVTADNDFWVSYAALQNTKILIIGIKLHSC